VGAEKTGGFVTMLQVRAYLPNLPEEITADRLEHLQESAASRETLLFQIVQGFERKYGYPLEVLERQLDNREIAEHPAWEESIEWRNALEDLERAHVSRSIFAWLDNLLVQSATS
jgi:hypothetical protein